MLGVNFAIYSFLDYKLNIVYYKICFNLPKKKKRKEQRSIKNKYKNNNYTLKLMEVIKYLSIHLRNSFIF